MTSVASRLKDALWSIRRRFGMESDIDRVIPFLVFEHELNQGQVEDLFASYPNRIPEDFKSVLLAEIRNAIRRYWQFSQTRKGFHQVIKSIKLLNNVARYGFDAYLLVEDYAGSFHLKLKTELK